LEFDYVIVGGGSAGSVLAARLSENRRNAVCLIEAGGMGRDILVRVPAGVAAMLPGRPRIHNWAYETEPQPGLNGRTGYQPRGKGLGGCSAINAMLYVRGHPQDYNDWQKAGCTGWSWKHVLPYFIRSEANERGADALHGGGGPLDVADQQSPRPVTAAFIAACAENQIPLNVDFNGRIQEGAGYFQVTQFWRDGRDGERCSAAAAYLHPALRRPNLTVVTKAHAEEILFEGRRAVAIRYRRKGLAHVMRARREIVLSAGTFNTPQLLMLSGIGRPEELKRQGIAVRHDLPGVGANLQDHPDFTMSWRSLDTDVFGIGLRGLANLLRAAMQWRRDGTGMMATPYAEAGAFLRSDPALRRPDLQLHFVIGIVDDHARKRHLGYGFSCHVCVLRPFSRGEVGLLNADPASQPRIDPRFLSDERDAALILRGARIMERVLAAPALNAFRKRQLYLRGDENDTELLEHIRSRADTIYHPVGTCRMGRDAMAVVDPRLKVRGIGGLRIADASVMPTLIGGNTNAPAMMIAEKAADLIGGKAD
jgi:choline dehydrogenase-like flavoprotein